MHIVSITATILIIAHLFLLLTRGSLLVDFFIPCCGNVPQIILLASVCILYKLFFASKRNFSQDKILLFWCIAYGAIAVISTLQSPYTSNTLYLSILAGLNLVALVYCLPKMITKAHYRIIFSAIAAVFVAHAAAELYLIINQSSTFMGRDILWEHGRLKAFPFLKPYTGGLYTNPNTIACYLILMPAILVHLFHETKNKLERATIVISIFLLLVSLLITFSRASLITAFLGLLPLPVIFLRNRGVPYWLSTTVILVGGGLAYVYLQHQTTLPHPFYLSGRNELWSDFQSIVRHSGFIGSGMFAVSSGGLTPHNFWMANLVYLGVGGFTCMLGWSLCLLRRSLRTLYLYRHIKIVVLFSALFAFIGVYGLQEYAFTYPLFFANSLSLILIGYLANFSERANSTGKERKPGATARREPAVAGERSTR